MDQFAQYSFEELILNTEFRRRVLHATPREALEFRAWLDGHPEQRAKFLAAEETIRAVQPENIPLSNEQYQDAVESIFALTSRRESLQKSCSFRKVAVAIVAAMVILIGIFWFRDRIEGQAVNQLSMQRDNPQSGWRQNKGATSELVRLSDGSTVVLKPGSSLRYPRIFAKDQRNVELKGEAFFEISKDSLRPFYVYANESVTKVLGTSFNIRALPDERNIIVKVQSGKVSVSHIHGPVTPERKEVATIIVDNQKLTMDRAGKEVEKAEIAPGEEMLKALVSDARVRERPVGEIFEELQSAYGVVIAYDHRKMASCSILANMEDLHLLERMDAICLAVNASYRVDNGRITILSSGCDSRNQ